MSATEFEIEQRRLRAAHRLPSQCVEDFQRLSRSLLHGPVFQWMLVDAPHEGLRKQVMAALDDVLQAAGLQVNRLPLSGRIDDVPALEARLIKNAGQAQVVHVIGRPGWFTAARWDAFNARRERVAQQARARLVFWLDEAAIELASRGAPDLWAWRAGVYAFRPVTPEQAVDASETSPPLALRPHGAGTRSSGQRLARRTAIQSWLRAHPDAPYDLLVGPLDELGQLLYDAGDFDDALAHWREQVLPVVGRLGDARGRAVAQSRIADVLQARGQLDEALRIRREEELPVFELLGDAREYAVTQGRIADLLQVKGQLDEALRIRREEELPVYESLGDVHSHAIAQGKIADVLMAKGMLDEALLVWREEVLPVLEMLGDVRSRAMTQGRIADVLQARGQLDEALRIRREEVLPVFEKLGDVRARAAVQGRIADVLQARGQLDEALRIRREEELPVYEKLGTARERALTQWKVANQLLARTPPQRNEALALLGAAHAALVGMGLPEADELLRQVHRAGLELPATAPKSAS